MLRLGHWGIILLWVAAAAGCAYPRRSTSLSPVGEAAGGLHAPAHVWQLRILSATVPPRKRGGMAWDEDGSLPDAFVKIYRGNELVFETPVREDALDPSFDTLLPRNVAFPPGTELRVELWDRDAGPSNDPIGIWRGNGLPPNALPDADARIGMEGGASLLFRILRPRAHRGVGISLFEVRGDSLRVIEVLEHSPAGRAGVVPGDRIVAIGGRRVEDLSEAESASALSMAAERRQSLTLRRADGREAQIELDRGYVWLVM